MRTPAFVIASLAVLVGCTVDAPEYSEPAPPDATGAPPDAPAVDAAPIDGASDPVTIELSVAAVDVTESEEVSFEISLSGEITEALVLELTPSDDARLSVVPGAISFTAVDANEPRSVVVSAIPDDDAMDDEVFVVAAIAGVAEASVVVSVRDDDHQSLVASPAEELEVIEGGGTVLEVRLSAAPASSLVVLATSSGVAAEVSPSSRSFTSDNWDVPQVFFVTAAHDDDVVDGSAEIVLTADNVASVPVAVRVTDDDVLGILPSTTHLGTLAEGTSTTFNVQLTQQPTSAVTVVLEASHPDTVIHPSSLSFGPGDWADARVVDVSAVHDLDVADEQVVIELSAPGLSTRTVSTSIADDDTQSIVVEPEEVMLLEGSSVDVGVRLAYAPVGTTTVSVATLNPSVATASPATLSFTAANYAVAQAVTVTALDDTNLVASATTLRVQSLAEGLSRDAAVNVTDDDEQVIITTGMTAVLEGATQTLQARLGFQPTGPVQVTIESLDAERLTLSTSTLTFTTANWSTFQSVTATSAQDDDLRDDLVTVRFTAAGLLTSSALVTVLDNDVQEILLSSPATISVVEGSSAPLGVSLRFRPDGDVSVSMNFGNAHVIAIPSTLVFTPLNWNEVQTAQLQGVHDDDVASSTTTLSVSAPGVAVESIEIHVVDDDVITVLTDVASLEASERGTALVFYRLSHRPSGSVAVSIAVATPELAALSDESFVFTEANWSQPQPLIVTPAIDDDVEDESGFVTFSPAGWNMSSLQLTVEDRTRLAGFTGGPYSPDPIEDLPLDTLVAYRIVVPHAIVVEKIGFHVSGQQLGARARVGLYHGSETAPGTLSRWSAPFDVVTGSNFVEVQLMSAVAGDVLWVVIEIDASVAVSKGQGVGARRCTTAASFSAPFPNPFPAASCTATNEYEVFLVGFH